MAGFRGAVLYAAELPWFRDSILSEGSTKLGQLHMEILSNKRGFPPDAFVFSENTQINTLGHMLIKPTIQGLSVFTRANSWFGHMGDN